MNNKFYSCISKILYIFLLILFLSSCKKDTSPISVYDEFNIANFNKGPINIQEFDGYSNENQIKLFWITGRPILDPLEPVPPNVDEVRLFKSEIGPDDGFVQIYSSMRDGEDSTSISNLNVNIVYYFRIATFTKNNSLIGVSKPIMTKLGKENIAYHAIQIPKKESPLYQNNLSWSPNGNNLALIMADDSFYPNIFIFEVNTFAIQQITNYSSDEHRLLGIEYSSNGDKLAFCYTSSLTFGNIDYRIWVLNLNNFNTFPATSGRVDSYPTWISNDKILFCKGTYDPPNIPELCIKNLTDNSEIKITTYNGIYKYSPSYSMLKNQIVYSGETSDSRILYLVNTNGGNNTPLTTNSYWKDLYPHWSNDGEKIYFTSNRSGHFEIWAIDLVSREYLQITHGLKRNINKYYGKIDPNENYLAVIEFDKDRNYKLKLLDYNSSKIIL